MCLLSSECVKAEAPLSKFSLHLIHVLHRIPQLRISKQGLLPGERPEDAAPCSGAQRLISQLRCNSLFCVPSASAMGLGVVELSIALRIPKAFSCSQGGNKQPRPHRYIIVCLICVKWRANLTPTDRNISTTRSRAIQHLYLSNYLPAVVKTTPKHFGHTSSIG